MRINPKHNDVNGSKIMKDAKALTLVLKLSTKQE